MKLVVGEHCVHTDGIYHSRSARHSDQFVSYALGRFAEMEVRCCSRLLLMVADACRVQGCSDPSFDAPLWSMDRMHSQHQHLSKLPESQNLKFCKDAA